MEASVQTPRLVLLLETLKNRLLYCFFRVKYRHSLADENKIIRVRTADIRYKLPGNKRAHKRIAPITGGDWDRHVIPVGAMDKVVAIDQHFNHGIPWRQTQVFERYRYKLSQGRQALDCDTEEEIEAYYHQRFNRYLYASIENHGILSPAEDASVKPIHVYIDRHGQFLYGTGGNHRLGMAILLGIETMPVLIRGRHEKWQAHRAHVQRQTRHTSPWHPDLADL